MPRFASNRLDEPLVFDDTISFVGGQVSDVRPNLLNDNQYSDAKNMDVDTFGTVVTRKGTVKHPSTALTNNIQGLAYYDRPVTSVEKLACVSNGGFYLAGASDSSWTQVTGTNSSFNTGNMVDMVQFVDKLFIVDGANNLRYYDPTASPNIQEIASPTGLNLIMDGLVSHGNRLFGFGVDGQENDAIIHSKVIDADQTSSWSTNQQFRVGGHSGDPVVALYSWANNNLVVLKEASVYLVNADPSLLVASNFTITQISDRFGCVGRRTVVGVSGDVFYLSRFGVMSIGQILNGAQTIVQPQPVSTPIRDYIERINWDHASKACATFWNNRYLLSVPIDESTTNNYTFCFNTITKSWTGYWTGWTPTVFAASAFSGQLRLNFGQHDGKTLKWLEYTAQNDESDSTFKDDGAFYPSFVKSRGFVFREQLNDKIGRNAEFEFNNSRALVDVFQIRDDLLTEQRLNNEKINTAAGSGVVLPKALPFGFGQTEVVKRAYSTISKGTFNQVQYRVEADENKIQLRGIKASAIVMGLDAEKR